MAQSGIIGLKCKAYYNTATFATPTWAVISLIDELTLKGDFEKLSADSRESIVALWLKGKLNLEVTFTMRKDIANTAFGVIDAAVTTYDIIDLLFLDGASNFNTARGYRFEAQVFGHGEKQGKGDVLYPEYLVAPAPTTNGPPARAVVASGAPVFTSLSA